MLDCRSAKTFLPLLIFLAGASAPTSAPTTRPVGSLATLRVEVKDVRNHKGQLIFGVFTAADGFPSDEAKSVCWQVKAVDADTVVFTTSLPPGRYGASVLHDENKNKKMDLNLLGIPKEGYGETNNPKPKFRAATFEESLFDLPADGKILQISIQYF